MIHVKYGYLSHGIFDGCMSVAPVVDSIDPYNLACSYSFRPYQLVPSTQHDEPIMFIHSAGTHYDTCNFTNAFGKYPGKKSWVPLAWLNHGYMDINMTYVGVLLFGWRVPVPELGGLMVVMNLHCSRIELNHRYVNNTIAKQCLRVKVKGTTFSLGTRISRNNVAFSILIFIGYLMSYNNT
ncbi:uncharacterized protein LOC114530607 [Dendronephthya gigantea]|uniref:uncharacterized protein LOC114530607 n=1 Tax=Dendronephthya gigantea TaxID=151771 RepID=UPI00106CBB37|nr:uncharacterized protein LOC114530607 [Dendronephthya gigantea]